MKLYGAIDLHSNNNVTVLIDEQDQVVYQKRLPNDLPLIAQQLSGYRDRLQGIVVESTYNWYGRNFGARSCHRTFVAPRDATPVIFRQFTRSRHFRFLKSGQ